MQRDSSFYSWLNSLHRLSVTADSHFHFSPEEKQTFNKQKYRNCNNKKLNTHQQELVFVFYTLSNYCSWFMQPQSSVICLEMPVTRLLLISNKIPQPILFSDVINGFDATHAHVFFSLRAHLTLLYGKEKKRNSRTLAFWLSLLSRKKNSDVINSFDARTRIFFSASLAPYGKL